MSAPLDRTRNALADHDRALHGLFDALLGDLVPGDGSGANPPTARHPGAPSGVAPFNDPADLPLTEEMPLQGGVRHSWAAQRFKVLLFGIGGLQLAMPLLLMRGVSRLPPRLHRLPGGPVWLLGLTHRQGTTVTVADLGPLLGIGESCKAPRYLLVIGDGRVGVVCEHLEDTLLVDPGAVRWRRGPSRATWLAGVLSGSLCALLDADVISEAIRHG
ncbi:MAG: chemotaxis protein CheW [Gammaproteobacteria bacterium]|nr:chemotaxis protein CheW [Gammaproteobacteria bacterium]